MSLDNFRRKKKDKKERRIKKDKVPCKSRVEMRLGGGLLKLKNGRLPFQVGLGVASLINTNTNFAALVNTIWLSCFFTNIIIFIFCLELGEWYCWSWSWRNCRKSHGGYGAEERMLLKLKPSDKHHLFLDLVLVFVFSFGLKSDHLSSLGECTE